MIFTMRPPGRQLMTLGKLCCIVDVYKYFRIKQLLLMLSILMSSTIFRSCYGSGTERSMYHLSFMWYTGFGGIACCLFANLGTLFFGKNKMEDLSPELISPVLRRYFASQLRQNNFQLKYMEAKEKEALNS